MKTTRELIELIQVKKIEENTFSGKSITVGSDHVFGGQVLAQSLYAAYQTVPEERICHSMHAYFLLPGDLDHEILYHVQDLRDGGSFTTRYVSAEQLGKTIFVMAASFQKQEEGYEFQMEMPHVQPPDKLLSWEEIYEQTKDFLPKGIGDFLGLERPIWFKPTLINNPLEKQDLPPHQDVWFQFKDMIGELDSTIFHCLLAYASDYNILITALQPHASHAHFGNTQMASIDHAMWFHRAPSNLTNWFLYHVDVPSTSNARGMTQGYIFCEEDQLIATVSQEGLMRKMRKI